MSIQMEAGGRFGQMLASALESKRMSIDDLAIAVKKETGEGTYEHMRKLYKGMAFPSRLLLKEICRILNLSFKEADEAATRDKVEKKFGSAFHRVVGRDPRVAEWEAIVPHLTEEQQHMLLTMARGLARENRKRS